MKARKLFKRSRTLAEKSQTIDGFKARQDYVFVLKGKVQIGDFVRGTDWGWERATGYLGYEIKNGYIITGASYNGYTCRKIQ
jgi:hypothetical protein